MSNEAYVKGLMMQEIVGAIPYAVEEYFGNYEGREYLVLPML